MTNIYKDAEKEIFLRNSIGTAFCRTNNTFRNKHKQQGIFISRLPEQNNSLHSIVSSLDESIELFGESYQFAQRNFKDNEPQNGSHYIEYQIFDSPFTTVYTIGTIKLKKEVLLPENKSYLLIRYSLLEALTNVKIKLNPLLSFRRIDELQKSSNKVIKDINYIDQGVVITAFDYPEFYVVLSKENSFLHNINWNKGVQYVNLFRSETEDLLSVGHFETYISPYESIVFYMGWHGTNPEKLRNKFVKAQKSHKNVNQTMTQQTIHLHKDTLLR